MSLGLTFLVGMVLGWFFRAAACGSTDPAWVPMSHVNGRILYGLKLTVDLGAGDAYGPVMEEITLGEVKFQQLTPEQKKHYGFSEAQYQRLLARLHSLDRTPDP